MTGREADRTRLNDFESLSPQFRIPHGRSLVKRARRLLSAVDAPAADLIVGDFNLTRGSAALRHFAPNHRHAFDLAGSGYGVSYHRRWPLYHIDHVLVAPGVSVQAYRLFDPGRRHHYIQQVIIAAED